MQCAWRTDTLDRHGWIESVTLHSADYADPIEGYVLRTGAIPAFAHAFGLDEQAFRHWFRVQRRDVLDRIAAFEVTDSVNRFLANVADELVEDGTARVFDLRALPRRRPPTAGGRP